MRGNLSVEPYYLLLAGGWIAGAGAPAIPNVQEPASLITGQTNQGPLPDTTAVPAVKASPSSSLLSMSPLPFESADATAAA
jgi:hypothetical protein